MTEEKSIAAEIRSSSFTSLTSPMDGIIDFDAGGNLPLSDELDDNGFPISPFCSSSSGSDDDDRNEPKSASENGASYDRRDEAGGFALDFYSCGTDWSCLAAASAAAPVQANEEKRSFVQRDLFQMWGIKKPPSGPVSGSRDLSPQWKRRQRRRTMISDTKDIGQVANSEAVRKKEGLGQSKPRSCPFYKKIPGTPFTVDAFRYGAIEGCTSYFLSHFHYDHYGGLSKRWSHGPIYCTALTARLVKMCLSVHTSYICPLELDIEYVINGIKVMMMEANHCPGAALIYFQLKDGKTYLHTGDFRACKSMQSHPILLNHRINTLYLDTTYLNPKYKFPPKEDVIDYVIRTTRNFLKKQPETLITVGAYSIGKEHVYLAISQALEVPIYANASRKRILQSFNWPELSGKLCSSGKSSPLHVLPISILQHENLVEYLKTYEPQFRAILAFRPTGWTYSDATGGQLDLIKPNSRGKITIYGVPYSEHSSFTELKEFVKFLRPEKIIPTVNVGNPANREKMQAYFHEWLKS